MKIKSMLIYYFLRKIPITDLIIYLRKIGFDVTLSFSRNKSSYIEQWWAQAFENLLAYNYILVEC